MLAAKKNDYAYNYLEERELNNYSPKRRLKVKSKNIKIKILSSILLFFICAFSYTAGTAVEAIKINQINDLKSELEDLNLKNERLSLRVSQLKSLDRIEELAINDLGMKKPDIRNVKIVSGEQAENIQKIILKTSFDSLNIADKSNDLKINDTNVHSYVVTISNLISNWLISN